MSSSVSSKHPYLYTMFTGQSTIVAKGSAFARDSMTVDLIIHFNCTFHWLDVFDDTHNRGIPELTWSTYQWWWKALHRKCYFYMDWSVKKEVANQNSSSYLVSY